MVGSPLAGIDLHELVDTRPYCDALNDLITLNKETGARGNPVWCNLPRKFNIAVSGRCVAAAIESSLHSQMHAPHAEMACGLIGCGR